MSLTRTIPRPRHLLRGRGQEPAGDAAAEACRLVLCTMTAVAIGLLVAFHCWLLWLRLSNLAILQPVVALRWTAALGLLGVLFWLRRRQSPAPWGRRSLVFWLLVLLLHWSAVPQPGAERDTSAKATGVLEAVLAVPVAMGVARCLRRALSRIRSQQHQAVQSKTVPRFAGDRCVSSLDLQRLLFPAAWSRPPPIPC